MICTTAGARVSGRSYGGGFSLFAALGNADLLESFRGGHELAAGFTIRRRISRPSERMNREVLEALDGEKAVTVLPLMRRSPDGAAQPGKRGPD